MLNKAVQDVLVLTIANIDVPVHFLTVGLEHEEGGLFASLYGTAAAKPWLERIEAEFPDVLSPERFAEAVRASGVLNTPRDLLRVLGAELMKRCYEEASKNGRPCWVATSFDQLGVSLLVGGLPPDATLHALVDARLNARIDQDN